MEELIAFGLIALAYWIGFSILRRLKALHESVEFLRECMVEAGVLLTQEQVNARMEAETDAELDEFTRKARERRGE